MSLLLLLFLGCWSSASRTLHLAMKGLIVDLLVDTAGNDVDLAFEVVQAQRRTNACSQAAFEPDLHEPSAAVCIEAQEYDGLRNGEELVAFDDGFVDALLGNEGMVVRWTRL